MIAGAVASQRSGGELFSLFRTPFPDVVSGNPADAPPLDPDSAAISARIAWEVPRLNDGTIPGRNTVYWGFKLTPRSPVYKVPPGASTQPVPTENPTSLPDANQVALAMAGVPIPKGAAVYGPTDGADQIMTVWSPAEDKMWEGYGMNHTALDVQFSPAGTGDISSSAIQSGGSLVVGKVYFYRASAVTGDGETGIITFTASGVPTRVARVIPSGASKTAQLKIWPKYRVDSMNIWRCEATNAATYPSSPATGDIHRFSATGPSGEVAGHLYRWSGSAWGPLLGVTIPAYNDFKLIAQLTPASHPTLFADNASLFTWTDGTAIPAVIDAAATIPITSTAIADDDTWRSYHVGTMLHASQCPGHWRTIASDQFGGPQGMGWASTATKIPASAGLVNKRDFDRGEIDHAVTMTLPSASDYGLGGFVPNTWSPSNPGPGGVTVPAGGWSDSTRWAHPAQSHDPGAQHAATAQMIAAGCPSNALAIPEGARWRLPADFDLDTIDTSGLTALQAKFCMMVAKCLKHYGAIPSDGGFTPSIHCAMPIIEDPTDPAIAIHGSPLGAGHPDAEYDGRHGTSWRPGYTGANSETTALLPRKNSGGTPNPAGCFPWDAIQIVRMGWAPGYTGTKFGVCTTTSGGCPVGGQ